MATVADVLQGFKALWDATAALTSVFTGGLYEGEIPEDKEPPYALVSCVWKERIQFSSAAIEVYTLTVKGWFESGARAAGTTLNTVLSTFDLQADLTIPGATHMRSIPVANANVPDKDRKDAAKVQTASRTWDIWIKV